MAGALCYLARRDASGPLSFEPTFGDVDDGSDNMSGDVSDCPPCAPGRSSELVAAQAAEEVGAVAQLLRDASQHRGSIEGHLCDLPSPEVGLSLGQLGWASGGEPRLDPPVQMGHVGVAELFQGCHGERGPTSRSTVEDGAPVRSEVWEMGRERGVRFELEEPTRHMHRAGDRSGGLPLSCLSDVHEQRAVGDLPPRFFSTSRFSIWRLASATSSEVVVDMVHLSLGGFVTARRPQSCAGNVRGFARALLAPCTRRTCGATPGLTMSRSVDRTSARHHRGRDERSGQAGHQPEAAPHPRPPRGCSGTGVAGPPD